MRRLAEEGIVERKRRSGSRISASDERGKTAWFMRFRAPGNPELVGVRIKTAVLTETDRAGEWSRALGARPAFLRLERELEIADSFPVLAVAYLDAGRFRPLLDFANEIIGYYHLRHLLHDRFNAPTLRTRQYARLRGADADIAHVLRVAAGTPVMTLETVNLSLHDEPIVYQEFHIPPNDLVLDLTRR
jgi:GntR family transcriptional regulator